MTNSHRNRPQLGAVTICQRTDPERAGGHRVPRPQRHGGSTDSCYPASPVRCFERQSSTTACPTCERLGHSYEECQVNKSIVQLVRRGTLPTLLSILCLLAFPSCGGAGSSDSPTQAIMRQVKSYAYGRHECFDFDLKDVTAESAGDVAVVKGRLTAVHTCGASRGISAERGTMRAFGDLGSHDLNDPRAALGQRFLAECRQDETGWRVERFIPIW